MCLRKVKEGKSFFEFTGVFSRLKNPYLQILVLIFLIATLELWKFFYYRSNALVVPSQQTVSPCVCAGAPRSNAISQQTEENSECEFGKSIETKKCRKCDLPHHADRDFGFDWCEHDKVPLVEAIWRNVRHLGIPKHKCKQLKDFFMSLGLNYVDQYGFEVVNALRRDFDLRRKFEMGKITAHQLVFERHKFQSLDQGACTDQLGKGTNPKGSGSNKNLLLTTFFVTQRDPNHPTEPMKRNMPAIEDFLETTKPFFHKMHAVVFVDFPNAPKDTGIEFIFTKWKGVKYSINDYRYLLYLDYMKDHPEYEQVLIADMKDVKYGRDPWEYFRRRPRNIFIGSQPDIDVVWMRRRQRMCWGHRKDHSAGPKKVKRVMGLMRPYKRKYIQPNAGILGGSYKEVLEIVDEMVDIFKNSGQAPGCNSNMVAFAVVMYDRWKAGKVEWGQPLHSPFREYILPSPEYVIFHK